MQLLSLSAPGSPMISSVLPYYSASSRELLKIDIDIKSDPTVSLLVTVATCMHGVTSPFNVYMARVVFLGKI